MIIKIEQLQKRFKKHYALDGISAELSSGRVVSLIGPNGSGKTTLIKSILGMVRPDKGKIFFDGINIRRNNQYRSRIGYMPQIGRYPDNMKIGQVLDMIKNIRGVANQKIDDELYRAFDMGAISDKAMQNLSGGTRQKVSATLAFMFDADVYILDEPTAGLDPVASEILKDKINKEKKAGKLILITSHILSDLDELTTDVMYLQEGRLQLYDSLADIKDYTGEDRLGKAIAKLMQHGFKRDAFAEHTIHHIQTMSHVKDR
jgi:Cu-processing system ATP-binding protein